MINNKKRQSQLFKKKAIMKYIMATFETQESFSLYADDQLYARIKAPFNKFYGYKVIKHAYYLKIYKKEIADNGFTSYAKLKPVYNLCKVRKV